MIRDWLYCLGHLENLIAERARNLADASARFLGGAFVSSESSRFLEIVAIASTAAKNAAWFAIEGLVKPLIFRTNCKDAA